MTIHEHTLTAKQFDIKSWANALRIHQWLKNLLLFVPLLAAHQVNNPNQWATLCLAFFSFNFCASAGYIVNDLLDIQSDRLHPRKRNRPFASRQISVKTGIMLAVILSLLSFEIGTLINLQFLSCLVSYFVITCAYSSLFKRLILIDCITLAILYTLRIIAGAAACHIDLTFWLLAFSIFLFLSLAFLKRYAELEILKENSLQQEVFRRGYCTNDAPLIQMLGITSGYAAVLVLALYLNSEQITTLYRTPECIWVTIPVLLFWIGWMWIQAHRGNMYDDPLIFAIKDKASLLSGAAFAGALILGTVNWVG